ncbi:TPA: hypothetical protein RRU81_005269, partial [Klebsiella pneumoniae]|nr:hypothetical protein [Klebsiella pneumoniae]
MFSAILNTSKNSNAEKYKFLSLRIWRLVTVKTENSTTPKGFIDGVLTRNAFDLRPNEKSVSFSRLETEESIPNDSLKNKKLMACKIRTANKMQNIFISEESANNEDLRLDPETNELLKHISFSETENSKFSNDGITGFHWDLFFISKNGNKLRSGDSELSEKHILDAKDLLIEMSL